MAQFDESKVINCLHLEKAEVGKKYWVSNTLLHLKNRVENSSEFGYLCELKSIADCSSCCFETIDGREWEFLYPYEEPPNKRMTNRQFCEWVNRGNGQWKWKDVSQCHTDYSYSEEKDNNTVDEDIHIRPWGSEEWQEPTVAIYERDCKKERLLKCL